MAKQLNVDLRFTANNEQAKKQLQELQTALDNLMKTSSKNASGLGLTKDIAQATNEVAKLQAMLESSKNASGGLDLGKFNQSLEKGQVKISDYAKTLSSLGPQGDQAFSKMAKAIINAEVPLKRTNTLMKEFKTSLANTARWQLSSSILHGFMGAVQSAYGYAQDLNESLNNIRIVTGQSVDQMASFAKEANKAAQALSTTTTEYTNASLIYFQQGLNEKEVSARTEVTIKMANAAGQSAQVVSDQLTAVWNNFYDGSKSLEYYADVMTALGAATASSTDEIAGGLEKFAAIGQTIGLSYEYAASALATITANTRQSEEVVGTALKTIFARIQGLNLGETLDDGTTLNKYSEALQKVGISIFDQNGELKKMDNILDEMGSKWQTLSTAQQTALAQTVAGVRQYNQLISLMDNWDAGDSDSMMANLATSRGAEGTLQNQADIYAESWEAAKDRVTAAAEEIYNQLLNDKFFIDLNNGFAGFLNIVSNTIDALGGLPGVLSMSSVIMFKMFGKDMAKAIDDWGYNIQLRSKQGLQSILDLRQESITALSNMYADNVDTGPVNSTSQAVFQQQASLSEQMLIKEQELLSKGQALSEEKKRELQYLIQINEELGEQAIKAAQNLQSEQESEEVLKRRLNIMMMGHNKKAGNQEGSDTHINIGDVDKQIEKAKSLQMQYGALSAAHKDLQKSMKSGLSAKEAVVELEKMSQIAADAGFDISHFKNAIDQLSKGADIKTVLNSIETEMLEVGASAYEESEKIRTALQACGLEAKEIDPILDALYDSWVKQGVITEDVAKKLKNVANQAKDAGEKIKTVETPPPTIGQTFVTLASSIGNVTMALTTLKGVWDTWNNDDMSFGDKLLSTLTSLGMVIPMVVTSMQTLSKARVKDSIITALNTAAERKNKRAKMEFAAASKMAKNAQRDETEAQVKDIAVNKAQENSERSLSNSKKKGSVGPKKGGKFLSKGSTATLTEGGAAIGTTILAIAAAAAIIIGTVALVVHEMNKAERAVEKAKQTASELKQNYETVKAAQEEFNNQATTYENARDSVDKLIIGTEEYANAVRDANEAAMQLLETNKNLAYEIKDGQVIIDEESLKQQKEVAQQNLEYAQAAKMAGQTEVSKAEENLKKRDMARSLDTNLDDGVALGNAVAAGAAGAAAGALIGSIVPVIGTALGAAIGGLGGLIAGAISDATTGTATDAETDALERLEKAYLEDDTILQKIADGSMTDAEWDSIGIDDASLRAALQENSAEVSALVKEMAANTTAIDAQNDLVAANALADNVKVQDSDFKDQIIDIAGDAYGVAYDKAITSTETKEWGKKGIAQIDGANAEAKKVFAEYLKYAGLEGQGYELTDTTGNDDNRKFVYKDADGEEHEVSLEAMQAAKAAYEASNTLNDSAIKLAETFNNLAESSQGADQALLSFVSGKNFEGATNAEFQDMQAHVGAVNYDDATGRYDTTNIQSYVEASLGEALTDDVAVRYGYESADAMLQAFAEKLSKADEAWNSIEIPKNFAFAEDLSLGAAKALEDQVSKINLGPMGELAGQEYVEHLNKMLGELDPEDQQKALEELTKIDWSDWDAMEQAEDIMKDLGVEIDSASEEWKTFTENMRKAGNAIPDFSQLKSDLISVSGILNGLKFDSNISDDDYNTLIDYNDEWERYFILQTDGTRKFIGDSSQMLQATRDNINAQREDLKVRKELIEAAKEVNNYEKISALSIDKEYGDGKDGKISADTATANGYTDGEDMINQIMAAKAQEMIANNEAIKEILNSSGYDETVLNEIINEAIGGNRERLETMLTYIDDYMALDVETAEAEMNEMMASTATHIQELNQMLADQQISPEAWGQQAAYLETVAAQNAQTLAELDTVITDFGLQEDDETYIQNLMRIAEGYESCADELADYQAALSALSLDETNKELKEHAEAMEDSLRASIRLEEGAEEYGLEVESLQAQSKRLAKQYGLTAEEAANLAIKNQRMNKGVSSLVDNWKDWKKQLKNTDKTTQDYADAVVDCTEAIADLVGASKDLELPDEFFNDENMVLIERALQGDIEAINQLGAAVAYATVDTLEFQASLAQLATSTWIENGLEVDVTLDHEQFDLDKNTVLTGIEAIKNGTVSAGEAMDGEWVAALNRMALATGMSVEEMNGLLGSLGVQAKVDTTYVKQPMELPTYTEKVTNLSYRKIPATRYNEKGEAIGTYYQSVPEYTTASVPGPPLQTEGYVAVAQISTEDNPMTLDVSSNTVGGGSAPAATYSPNRGSVTPSAVQGNNSGGGGGGDETPAPAEKEKVQKRSEFGERYHTVTKQLENTSRELERASKAADKLWSRKRLKYLEEQNALLDEEIALLREQTRQAQDYLGLDQSDLDSTALDLGYTINYGENGEILNYDTIVDGYAQAMIAAQNHLNTLATKDEQDAYKEAFIDPLQEKIDAFNTAVDLYYETLNIIQDNNDLIQEKMDQQMENNFEKWSGELELDIAINERDLEILEYYLSKVEDDVYQMAEAVAIMVGSLGDLEGGGGGQLSEYLGNLDIYNTKLEELNTKLAAGEITEAAYEEGLEEIRAGLLENLEALNELDKAMLEYYSDTLSLVMEEMDKYTEKMEHQTSILEHYANMMEILGKSQDYEALGTILEGQVKTIENELAVAEAEFEMYSAEAESKRQLYEEAVASGNVEAAEVYKREWEAAESAAMEAQSEMLEKTEAWAEAMRAVVENQLSSLAKTLEQSLTGGTSFDYINTQLERAASLQEEYLTTTNQIYETNKLMRTAQQEIDKTTNTVAKQRLKNFIKETDQLQNKSKLSKYELEIQQAKYDLLLAEIALEEAQQAKSTVRLQRDSEGNFGYVYTADQNQLEQAQQQLEDAQNSLYNIGLEGANSYAEKYSQTMQEMYDTLTSISEAYFNGEIASQEEYEQQILAAQEYYYQQLENYQELYGIAVEVDTRIIKDAWSSNFTSMIHSTEEWKNKVDDYARDAAQSLHNWYTQVENIAKKTGLDNIAQKVQTVTDKSDELKDTILGTNGEKGVITALQDELTAVSNLTGGYANLRSTLQGIIATYEELMATVTAAQNNETPIDPTDPPNTDNDNNDNNNNDNNDNDNSGGSEPGDGGGNPGSGDTKSYQKGTISFSGNGSSRVWRDSSGKTYAYGSAEQKKMQQAFNKAYNSNGGYKGDYWIGWTNDGAKLNADVLHKKYGLSTGGYTGDWPGSYGKLAFLHQKELVLNAQDTENLLASMDILDKIISTIDLYSNSAQLGGLLHTPTYNGFGHNESLEQNVRIEASFPGVTDRNEIEEAFNNLINRASQYANRK